MCKKRSVDFRVIGGDTETISWRSCTECKSGVATVLHVSLSHFPDGDIFWQRLLFRFCRSCLWLLDWFWWGCFVLVFWLVVRGNNLIHALSPAFILIF